MPTEDMLTWSTVGAWHPTAGDPVSFRFGFLQCHWATYLTLTIRNSVTRIFLTLCIVSIIALAAAFWLGLEIGDATSRDPIVQKNVGNHILAGLAALVFALLVHAIVLTYFMGTGRWLEETTLAYHLPTKWQQESKTLKYRTIPAMVVCLVLLILTGAFGAAADPASATGFRGFGGLSADSLHMAIALTTLGVNLIVNLLEYSALHRNGVIVSEVLQEVRRIRLERGLEV